MRTTRGLKTPGVEVTPELLARLPKAELHVHLDGSLRPETMLELAAAQGKPMPADEPAALARHMYVPVGTPLDAFLTRFATTLSVLQTPDSLERAAYELVADAARENVRYIEVRYSPVLHRNEGMSLSEAVDAPLRGVRRAERDFGVRAALLICGIRNMGTEPSMELAELTVAYKGQGVVGFDLAGAEYNFPAKKHREAFYLVVDANLGVTIHAGEAYGPESIHQALHYCGANRIGHGARLIEDADLMAYVNDFRIPLEICLTSNIQTGAAPSFAAHPAGRYVREGLAVTLNTDNRLMSATTLTNEYWLAHEHLGLEWSDLCRIALAGFESGFLPYRDKVRLLDEVTAEIETLTAEAPTRRRGARVGV